MRCRPVSAYACEARGFFSVRMACERQPKALRPMSGRSQQISLQPAVLRWARERAGFSQDELAAKMRVKPECVQAWECSGTINIKHADRLAHCTYTPLGQLYLDAPRKDTLRIPDFRVQGPRVGSPTLRPGGVQGAPRG